MYIYILLILCSIVLLLIGFKLFTLAMNNNRNIKLTETQKMLDDLHPTFYKIQTLLKSFDSIIDTLHDLSKKLLFFRHY